MSNDKIIDFTQRLANQRSGNKESLGEGELPNLYFIDDITPKEVESFIRVLTYIKQHSHDGTGRLEFDDFRARLTLDFGHRQMHEDHGDRETGLQMTYQAEVLFPTIFTALNADDAKFEEEPTLEEVGIVVHDCLKQLESTEIE